MIFRERLLKRYKDSFKKPYGCFKYKLLTIAALILTVCLVFIMVELALVGLIATFICFRNLLRFGYAFRCNHELTITNDQIILKFRTFGTGTKSEECIQTCQIASLSGIEFYPKTQELVFLAPYDMVKEGVSLYGMITCHVYDDELIKYLNTHVMPVTYVYRGNASKRISSL